MPKKLKDTDYLSISARVRAMENGLLTRERMERMLEARSVEEAAKVLAECGYGEMNSFTPAALDERLSEARDAVYQDLQGAVPDPNVIDVFRIKYDYHNAKVLLKAEAMGLDPVRLLVGGMPPPRCRRTSSGTTCGSAATPSARRWRRPRRPWPPAATPSGPT